MIDRKNKLHWYGKLRINQWDAFCQSQYNYCAFGTPLSTNTNISREAIKIYPNPTNDIININKFVDIWVINTLGDMIIHKTNINVLDVSRLRPGVYNLQIMCNNKIANKKIIKK